MQDSVICAVTCAEEFVSSGTRSAAPAVTGNDFPIHQYNLIHKADFIHLLFKTSQGIWKLMQAHKQQQERAL